MHYLVLDTLNIAALSVLGFITVQNDILLPRVRRSFLLAVAVTITVVLSEIVTSYLESHGMPLRGAAVACNVVGFALSPLVPVFIANAFGGGVCLRRAVLLLPAALNVPLTALSPAFGFIFVLSPEGLYSRGPLFFIYIVSYIASLAYLLWETLRAVSLYQNKNAFTLFLLYLFLLLGTSVQVGWPSVHAAWVCVSLAILMYYAYYCELVSKYDIMTNLFNRRVYESHLQQFAQKERASILLFDVDDFKSVNDNYGHPFGDQCLSDIAASIKGAFSGLGLCYRIGGDEFCVLSETTDEAALHAATAVFLEDIDSRRAQDPWLPMVSLGRALYARGETTIERAVKEADSRMFHYKQRRKEERKKEPQPCGGRPGERIGAAPRRALL